MLFMRKSNFHINRFINNRLCSSDMIRRLELLHEKELLKVLNQHGYSLDFDEISPFGLTTKKHINRK